MRSLFPYEKGGFGAFKAIVDAKKRKEDRALLLRLAPLVKRRWYTYAKAKRDLAAVGASPNFQASEKSALTGCYTSDSKDSKALSAVKARIRASQPEGFRSRCQYCCGASPASTWDHYVPEAKFPEFSVYPPNLVPCCHDCNERKQQWVNERGKRTTVNFYYDRFDAASTLLEARIEFEKDGLPGARFFVTERRPGRTPFGRLFRRHFRTLRLEERLREASASVMEVIKADINRWLGKHGWSPSEILTELASIAKSRAASFGANHYEAVLYRASAASPVLVEYCQAQDAGARLRSSARGGKR